MGQLKRPACVRCGVCCIAATCYLGKESSRTGLCVHLRINQREGYTTCKLIEKWGMPDSFGKGCVIHRDPVVFEEFRKLAETKIGHKLPGIGEQSAKNNNFESAKNY